MRGRGATLALLGLLGLLWGLDLGAPPPAQRTAAVLLGAVHLYQATLSPLAGRAGIVCRFEPTCSHYAAAVIARDGAVAGAARTLWRVARCGPWTPAGTVDLP